MRRRKRMLEELDQDIGDHIERETQDNIERGMLSEEARYAAMRKFGNVTRVKEETREVWSSVWLEQLLQDIHFGLRMLRKSPGFAVAAILTLALGIGANTAIFSLIDAVMLRSLPVENPSQLVVLRWGARNAPNIHGYMNSGDCPSDLKTSAANPSGCSFSEPLFREIAQANVFGATAAFANSGRLNLTGNGPATVINGQIVSGDFFRTMGLKPTAGRLFEVDDDKPSAAPVAVLNYGYWQSAFGGSRDVVGHAIELNNVPFTIIGVAEQRFTGIAPGSDYDVWLPLSVVAQVNTNLPLFDVKTESEQIDRLLFQEWLVAGLAGFFGLLALVLACVGLYGLLSYEVSRRTREIGIRMALGAHPGSVLKLVLRQGIVLAIIGAAIGIGVALGVTRYLTSMLYDVHANDPLTMIAVATLLTVVALTACYIPARRAMRVDPMVALRYE